MAGNTKLAAEQQPVEGYSKIGREKKNCSVIAFSNQKGGVGKSTSVVAAAGCLTKRGYSVLVVDTDPQATASSYLVPDFEEQEEGREASLYHLIMDENLSVPDSIVHTASGDLITASFLLYDMDRLGVGTSAIKEIVDEVRERYDFILLDTPPNLGWLQTAALEASDYIVIPTKATAQSIRGIPTLFDTVYYVQNTNPDLTVLGFLITMSNKRVLACRAIAEELETIAQQVGCQVFPAWIRLAEGLFGESEAMHTNIFRMHRKNNALKDYEAFVDALLEEVN